MTNIARELHDINSKVRRVTRTHQRSKPNNKQQEDGFRKAVWAMNRELAFELSQPLEHVLNDIDLDEVDNYDDELTQDELQSYVMSIRSDVDVSVCNNVFTIEVDVPEPRDVELPPMWNFVRKQEKENAITDLSGWTDAQRRNHIEGVRAYVERKNHRRLKTALMKKYAFDRFPNKDKRRAAGMTYAVIFNNKPIGENHNTVLYYKTLPEAKRAREDLILTHKFESKDVEILKTFGKN